MRPHARHAARRVNRPLVALRDGERAHCFKKTEALVLDHQVAAYWLHGIEVSDGDVVFDVGANIGLFSLRAVNRARDVQVYAFEPNAGTFEILQANRTLWGRAQLRAFPWALSNENGLARITSYHHSSTIATLNPELYENDTLLKESIRGIMKKTPRIYWWDRLPRWFFRVFSRAVARRVARGAEELVCEMRTISSVLREQCIARIDLLKVDCEGEELNVLQGIEPADWARVGQAVIEVHDIDGRVAVIRRLLECHGFARIVVEKEPEFETIPVYMVYARRA